MADIWGEEENDEQQEEDMLPEGDDEDEEEEDLLDMGDETAVQQEDALLMRFCPHDSSMLYPQVCINDLFAFFLLEANEVMFGWIDPLLTNVHCVSLNC